MYISIPIWLFILMIFVLPALGLFISALMQANKEQEVYYDSFWREAAFTSRSIMTEDQKAKLDEIMSHREVV